MEWGGFEKKEMEVAEILVDFGNLIARSDSLLFPIPSSWATTKKRRKRKRNHPSPPPAANSPMPHQPSNYSPQPPSTSVAATRVYFRRRKGLLCCENTQTKKMDFENLKKADYHKDYMKAQDEQKLQAHLMSVDCEKRSDQETPILDVDEAVVNMDHPTVGVVSRKNDPHDHCQYNQLRLPPPPSLLSNNLSPESDSRRMGKRVKNLDSTKQLSAPLFPISALIY